ncbi:30S ribosome-binding factor RbfA [Spiroplasma monobiae]|uniref:Ribosome-binding factor A n=1 Tax=Spiroplasma monobiae MQ-1 TaxID=1336748 RepID=A0A2K9LU38_SPISQ|nr:30S ribosome-binding factor RbfA [Spiroplasma monobiae]AUM62572.1 ribosome-binding factor A [Spiroplasma monobiae MQ-1]
MPNDIKIERNQSTILRELNLILQREFPDCEYLNTLTIHEVRLSNDMSHAKVFYSCMDTSADLADVKAEIDENLKEIRMILASKVEMRSVPELTFEFDKTLENANKIEEILKEIK